MKKIITTYENITPNTFDLPVNKDDQFIVLYKEDDNMSFELYNQLSRFQATVQFIKCETDKQKEVMYFLLGNLCAAKSSKQVQVYIVQEEKNAIPLEHLKNIVTLGVNFEEKNSVEEIYSVKKQKKSPANKTNESKEVKETTQKSTVAGNKKQTNTSKKAKDLKTALRKIEENFDFEPYLESIEEALRNSVETISFEVQLQIRTSNKEGSQIHKILAPHYEELKEYL